MGKTFKKDPEARNTHKKKASMYNRRAEKDLTRLSRGYNPSTEESDEEFLFQINTSKKKINDFR